MKAIALIAIAYLIGSIPSSLLIARYTRGIDLRQWGSGNLGATNLYRAVGVGYAAIAVAFDIGKGFIPARFFAQLDGLDAPALALAYGVAAVLGHVSSVWVKFRGGKGVATGGGVFFALAPAAAAVALAVWVVSAAGTRIVSVASLAAATALPLAIGFTRQDIDYVFWSSLPLTALVWWTHRSNIARLLARQEMPARRGVGSPAPEPGGPGSRET